MIPPRRSAGALLAGVLLAAAPAQVASAAPPDRAGQSIFLSGALGSGAPLEGSREGGGVVSGADAACVSCHQRSGLGSAEARLSIPPIAGEYLFQSQAPGEAPLPYVESLRGNRGPYTDETLARAIREGIDPEGRPLGYLMPRYALGDQDMAALIAYLRSLEVRRVPGVTDSVLHFATVITADADPVKRAGMLDVLEKFFAEKNSFPRKPSPPMWTSGRTQYAKSMYMANRRWQLHVWELTGPAAGWRAQLERHLAAEPVYAVVSGLGGTNWTPVHEFCEQNAIPCLFPNVEVPVVAEDDFYSMYYSRGVLLEAQLIARSILGAEGHPPARVEQVYRAGDSGEAAARALSAELERHGVEVRRTVLPAGARGRGVDAAVRPAGRARGAEGRVVVLWLRGSDLAALGEPPAEGTSLYVSGLMGGLESSPLPAGWRGHARMTYPLDLPQRRGVRLDYPFGWFTFRHIQVVAAQVQVDTYLTCSLLADILHRMGDNFARPYLIEQLQAQLEHRLITGYYPYLTLASHQRFASKGGYIVRFRDDAGTALVPEGEWTVP